MARERKTKEYKVKKNIRKDKLKKKVRETKIEGI
jgi:hypothetical protein